MNDYREEKSVLEADADMDRRDASSSLSDRVRSLRLPDAKYAPAPRVAWLPWTLLLVFAGSTAFLSYRELNKSDSETPPAAESAATGSRTDFPAPAVASSGEVVLESKGYVIPVHQIQVSPKVSGMVEKLRFEEGLRVKKGDVLAQLETTDYLADRDHARAAVEATRQRLLELEHGSRPEEIQSARADLAESQAQREQLFLDWKRNVGLKNGNALAPRDYEQAYSAYKAMDRHVERLRQSLKLMEDGPRIERIEAARGDLRQAEADLVKAEWRLENCTVRAPISGTILTKKAEEGNIVNPIAFNISASLCEMADLSDLEIDLTIQERDIAKVFKNQKCHLHAEAFPEKVYDGFVSRLMPIADRAKGAVPVRVKVTVPKEEEGRYLKPEMGAIVSFMKKS